MTPDEAAGTDDHLDGGVRPMTFASEVETRRRTKPRMLAAITAVPETLL